MAPVPQKLRYFQVASFSIVLGTAGLALGWLKAHEVLALPAWPGETLRVLSLLVFLLVTLLYALKILRHREEVREELQHPVKMSFFPAFSISLVLASMLTLDISMRVSHGFWLAGAAIHLWLTVSVLSQWMHQTHFRIHHGTPAWFIPVVGNILMPIAGVPHGYVELSWFFFSIGLVYWIVLKVLVFNRIIFHEPMPAKLLPTLFILIAPPAGGFLAYLQLTGGELNDFARILYFSSLFMTLLLLAQCRRFFSPQFFLSWWAYSFPLAVFSVASQVYYQQVGHEIFRLIAYGSLALATAVIGMLLLRTLGAIRDGSVFEPD